jgi:hypothetical protein
MRNRIAGHRNRRHFVEAIPLYFLLSRPRSLVRGVLAVVNSTWAAPRCNSFLRILGKSVGIEVVGKGVVAICGLAADFDVVAGASVSCKDFLHFSTEVAFHFPNVSANAPADVFGAIRQNLLGEGVYAACRFS